jgi:AraC-like DNA-binding protein
VTYAPAERRPDPAGERRWSTAGRADHEQFAFWREIVCRAFVDLLPRRSARGAFAGSVRSHTLGPASVSVVASEAQVVLRTEDGIAASPAPLFFVITQLAGHGVVRQDGREAHLRPGDLALLDTLRPHELAFTGRFRQVAVHMPHAVLLPHLPAPAAATAVRVPGGEGVGALAATSLRASARCAGTLAEPAAVAVAEHLAGLVGLAARACAPAALRSRPGAHLDAAMGACERRLGDPDLDPRQVAAHVGVSTRYLHRLFAERGETFGGWLLGRRLAGAQRELADPAFAHLTVTEIALRWGFRSPSHFGRVFRERFGSVPSAVRPPAPPV